MALTMAPNVASSGSMSKARAMRGPSSTSDHKGNGRDLPGRSAIGGMAVLLAGRPALLAALLDHDFDAAVLRLAHAIAGLHQQALLAAADHTDRLRRHALA